MLVPSGKVRFHLLGDFRDLRLNGNRVTLFARRSTRSVIAGSGPTKKRRGRG